MRAARLSEAELVAEAGSLAGRLAPGSVLWLTGDLGAGKTTFARAVLHGLGVAEAATSPTYGLVHRHQGRRGPVFHVDCYRLAEPDEARDLDWAVLAAGDALVIEWPERAGPWAPAPTCTVHLEHDPDPDRRVVSIQ